MQAPILLTTTTYCFMYSLNLNMDVLVGHVKSILVFSPFSSRFNEFKCPLTKLQFFEQHRDERVGPVLNHQCSVILDLKKQQETSPCQACHLIAEGKQSTCSTSSSPDFSISWKWLQGQAGRGLLWISCCYVMQ